MPPDQTAIVQHYRRLAELVPAHWQTGLIEAEDGARIRAPRGDLPRTGGRAGRPRAAKLRCSAVDQPRRSATLDGADHRDHAGAQDAAARGTHADRVTPASTRSTGLGRGRLCELR